MNNKTSPYWQHAVDAMVRVRADFAGPIQRGHMNMPWPESTDPKKLPLALLKVKYENSVRVYKPAIVETVWESDAIDKKDKAEFFVAILKNDDSLSATFLAGRHFVQMVSDPSLTWNPFATKPLLDWWAANGDTFGQVKK
ncbi:MAG: hypothetical protein ABFD90_20440 [Phycisphaerales bacterium]